MPLKIDTMGVDVVAAFQEAAECTVVMVVDMEATVVEDIGIHIGVDHYVPQYEKVLCHQQSITILGVVLFMV
jgi:hypothetical protein